MKLDAKNLGLAGGILWGVSLFILTLISIPTGYASACLKAISGFYIGYKISVIGAFIGLIYGFIDAFIGLYLFALLYNFLQRKTQK